MKCAVVQPLAQVVVGTDAPVCGGTGHLGTQPAVGLEPVLLHREGLRTEQTQEVGGVDDELEDVKQSQFEC